MSARTIKSLDSHFTLPQSAQRPFPSLPERPKTAFRRRSPTPYPSTRHPDGLNPDTPYSDTPYPDILSPDSPFSDTPYADIQCPDSAITDIPYPDTPHPEAGAEAENTVKEDFLGLAARRKDRRGSGNETDAKLECVLVAEVAAKSECQKRLDDQLHFEVAKEKIFIVGPDCTLSRDAKYLRSCGVESKGEPYADNCEGPLMYRFPHSISMAPLEDLDSMHRKSTYPFLFSRLALIKIIATAKHAALNQYEEHTVLHTSSDGFQYPPDYSELTKLIDNKLALALRSSVDTLRPQRVTLKEFKEATGKKLCVGKDEDMFKKARAQPRLCAMVRRKATRAVEEAFEEFDRRLGIVGIKEFQGSHTIVKATNTLRPAFSFDYPEIRLTIASSPLFPCLCKEGFANKMCSQVLADARTGLEQAPIGSAEYRCWEAQFRHNLNTLVPEAMVKALAEIHEPEDEDRCCGWGEMTHVQPWMAKKLKVYATNAVEKISDYQSDLRVELSELD